MPYINIPESNLSGTIAKLVGKIEGEVTGKIIAKANEIQNSFRSQGCPADIDRVSNVVDRLNSSSQTIDNRLDRFRKLPSKLRPPIRGLEAAIKIILTLPIPQSVPPGFGLPINITTKYSDFLVFLKEFVKQIKDDVTAITYIVDGPSNQLTSVKNLLDRTNFAVKGCQIEKALKEKIDSGELSTDQLKQAGLIDEDEIFIFSSLSPRLINIPEGRTVSDIANEFNITNEQAAAQINQQIQTRRQQGSIQPSTITGVSELTLRQVGTTGVGSGTATGDLFNDGTRTDGIIDSGTGLGISPNSSLVPFSSNIQATTQLLLDSLNRLDKNILSQDLLNDLRNSLDGFTQLSPQDISRDSRFTHTGPDGTIYTLAIETDPNSPPIAPRRFATATNQEGVVLFKGPKSFSSSTDVLLQEIKFRIDNQLS